MSALATLQKQFQQSIHDLSDIVEAEIVGTERVDAAGRVAIYSNGYRLRILEALGNDYPALKMLAGDETFDTLGQIYINSQPSTFFNLRWYGGGLEAFLRDTYPRESAWHEMAAFEWGMGLSFDAPDDPVITFEDMAVVAPEAWPGLSFRLHPSVRRLDLVWSIADYWKAVNQEQVLPELQGAETARPWIVWRKDLATYFRPLTADEAWALDAAAEGKNFSEICEGLAEWVAEDQVALHAASLLRNWVNEQMITRINLAG